MQRRAATGPPSRDDARTTPRTEEIHLRNFDVERTYRLRVVLRRARTRVFDDRYVLGPGETASELDCLRPGEYDVRVELDGRRTRRTRCRVDRSPEHTVLIELGNGTVSVTEGLYV